MGYIRDRATSGTKLTPFLLTFGAGPGTILKNYSFKPIFWCGNRNGTAWRWWVHSPYGLQGMAAMVHPCKQKHRRKTCLSATDVHVSLGTTTTQYIHWVAFQKMIFSQLYRLDIQDQGFVKALFLMFLLWTQREKGHWLSDTFSY